MKVLSLLLCSFVLFSFAHVDTLRVDTAASSIAWTGYKVTGQHAGVVKVKSGSIAMDHGTLVGGTFEIDMTSMTCTDLQGEMAGKLVGHLSSPDFFGTEKYPSAKFEITRAIATDTKGNYKVIGKLTIKETTKEVKFNANVSADGGKTIATGKIVVDRSDFDIRYGSGSFFDGLGDKTIYDDFDLNVRLVASK
jgi:polyisoprenoid-binding protein YceI